jgi:hypothetical protein
MRTIRLRFRKGPRESDICHFECFSPEHLLAQATGKILAESDPYPSLPSLSYECNSSEIVGALPESGISPGQWNRKLLVSLPLQRTEAYRTAARDSASVKDSIR